MWKTKQCQDALRFADECEEADDELPNLRESLHASKRLEVIRELVDTCLELIAEITDRNKDDK